ncbi:CP4-57 prophage; toxin of the YpjF-YfjZ toxin-antitoxin system [Enterobacter kobei]|uniref:TA system toxin CbtA family protein n=1 Tax=Enterobacteriaceae TaxID=543 RepID=UPI0006682730|nr:MULTISPECIES: TA system toxin CbtA family protein [Enterobacterales]MCW1828930.1 toxin [Enterobacter asburiae]QHM75734.1 putative toxin YpjF [Mixta theicola]VAL15507.1 CP4-57 prophage; toxin of the YpjF-YfjZ toxin-antitoxin system [Enterobacter kobei]
MRIYPVSAKRAAEIERLTHKSAIYVWRRLLTYLLDRHYGLTLNDTPFGDDDAIQECIDAGDALIDALNEVVEDCDLARIDNRGKSLLSVSPLLTPADIRNAQNAVGLEGSNNTLIISGQSSARS